MHTDGTPLSISDGGAIISEVISSSSSIAGEIIVTIADAIDGVMAGETVVGTIDHVADLFTEITDLIGDSLVPIYDVSYLSLSIIIYIINE